MCRVGAVVKRAAALEPVPLEARLDPALSTRRVGVFGILGGLAPLVEGASAGEGERLRFKVRWVAGGGAREAGGEDDLEEDEPGRFRFRDRVVAGGAEETDSEEELEEGDTGSFLFRDEVGGEVAEESDSEEELEEEDTEALRSKAVNGVGGEGAEEEDDEEPEDVDSERFLGKGGAWVFWGKPGEVNDEDDEEVLEAEEVEWLGLVVFKGLEFLSVPLELDDLAEAEGLLKGTIVSTLIELAFSAFSEGSRFEAPLSLLLSPLLSLPLSSSVTLETLSFFFCPRASTTGSSSSDRALS